MMTPTIHLNGTSRDALLDQVTAAERALDDALRVMEAAAPNARDYYPQGPDAFAKAQDEHKARIEKVRSVFVEYFDTADYLAGQ